ncbi:MAG: TetR/AcrR family transcriptional regulator [bacterium]|nr:TetR/AcrR family transcriptional regulator [bacterium]
MAPEHKTSKEEIIRAALELIKEGGLKMITAREVAKQLNLSSRPIYSFYPSMDELKKDVINNIVEKYQQAAMSTNSNDSFLNMGLAQVRFAREEPIFYRILINESKNKSYNDLTEESLIKLKEDSPYSDLPDETLRDLLLKMAIFTSGLAEAVMNDMLPDNSDEAISKILYETGEAIIIQAYKKFKGGSK